MPRIYSVDLRKKVLSAIDNGSKAVALSKLFQIDRKTIYNWQNKLKKLKSLEPIKIRPRILSRKIQDLDTFKKFVQNVVKKKDALPFRVPKNINLVMVDLETGLQPNVNTKKIIYESYKSNDNFMLDLQKLTNIGTSKVYNSKNQSLIFKFY